MGEQVDSRETRQQSQTWTPAFPGQRPPLTAEQWAEPGNERALVHGARSPRHVNPVAERIEQDARALDTWPAYLNEPTYAAAVQAWARAEATVELLWTWLAERDLESWLTEVTEVEGSERADKGRVTRRSTTRRIGAVLDQLARWEGMAAARRSRLGLDPLSRARLGRDVTASEVSFVELLTQAREAAEKAAQDAQGGSG